MATLHSRIVPARFPLDSSARRTSSLIPLASKEKGLASIRRALFLLASLLLHGAVDHSFKAQLCRRGSTRWPNREGGEALFREGAFRDKEDFPKPIPTGAIPPLMKCTLLDNLAQYHPSRERACPLGTPYLLDCRFPPPSDGACKLAGE